MAANARPTVFGLQRLLWVPLCVLLAGCASLPAEVLRSPSVALAPDLHAPLSQLAGHGPAPGLSGFHLMPTGQMALLTRLDLVRRAQRSLDVQAYQIQNDATGRIFLRLLRDAAVRGVRVRLLLDDLYTAGHDELLLGLAAHANVELRLFNPFPAGRDSLTQRFTASLFDFGRVHRRMHNKLLVADGTMAIVGGRNIADDYFMRQEGDNFIDLDTLVVGAVLPTLSTLFDRYWNSRHALPIAAMVASTVPGQVLQQDFERRTGPDSTPLPETPDGPDRFGARPAFEALDAGTLRWIWARAEAYADDPDKILGRETAQDSAPPADRQGIRYRLVELIRDAQREVRIATPYLVPTRRSLDTTALLRERGVRMTVLTNSLAATDEPVVHSGYRRYRDNLLRQGVELYELAPLKVPRTVRMTRLGDAVGRLHAKAVVIDRTIFFIGSFNFDQRSATHNTELGLIVFSPALAEQALGLLDGLQREGAYRLRLQPDGHSIEWLQRGEDGREHLRDEPDPGWWRRLLLELIGPFVPEDLL